MEKRIKSKLKYWIENTMTDKNIYLHDGRIFRFQELVIINNSLNISNFLYGYCHIFALALSHHFGDDAECYCRLVYEDGKPHLAHAYAKINGNFVDARGIIDEYDIDNYTTDSFEFDEFKISPEDILNECKDISWGAIKDNVLEDAKAFISKYEDLYSGRLPDINTYLKFKDELDKLTIEEIEDDPECFNT